jgi:hypothetical protein
VGSAGPTTARRPSRIQVSPLYVARSEAGRAVDALAGRPLLVSRPGQPAVDLVHITWHKIQVFKVTYHRAKPSRVARDEGS